MRATGTGKTYRNQSLSLDGKRFASCLFDNCRLDYAGGIPPELSNCRFDGCTFSFSGPAARTLGFLGGLHGGGFASVVEETFRAIRSGTYRELPADDLTRGPQQPRPSPDLHPLGLRTPRVIEVPKRRD